MSEEKILYLITGPIGAGKSTYAKCLIEYFGLSSLEYISADIYYLQYFKGYSPTEGDAYANAKKYGYYKLNKAVSQGRSFLWETVVAKEKKMELIQSILDRGYHLKCFYIGMDGFNIPIARVAQRYEQGWYTVPESKIIDRYQKSMNYLYQLMQLAESMIIIDSSSEHGKIVKWKESNAIQYSDVYCNWLPKPN